MLEKPLNPPCQATLGKQSNIFHNNPENTQSICVHNFIDKSSRSEICIATLLLHMTQFHFFYCNAIRGNIGKWVKKDQKEKQWNLNINLCLLLT